MSIQFEASNQRLAVGCAIGLAVVCGFGMSTFGDRNPSYSVTIENRTRRPLAVVFSDMIVTLNGLPQTLPRGTTTFYGVFSRGSQGPDLIGLYRSRTDTTKPLCARAVSKDVDALDEKRSHLVVEPAGEGCRIFVVDGRSSP